MKRKITFLLAALLLMSGLTWAQTDVLNHDVIGVSGSSYSSWSELTLTSGAVYAGNTAGSYDAIQMRSNNNNSGIVTTTSAGIVTNVTVAWNSNTNAARKLNVYGSNTAYEAASDLYGDNAGTLIGTINYGDTELEITDEYAFIGVRSYSGALYLDEIQITWSNGSGVTPPSITASNVEIAYDATEGAIEYSINNAVADGVLTATTEDEWLTLGTVDETVPFTCSVNDNGERVATVTLTYTYNTDQTVTKNVTVTQDTNPNIPGTQNNPYTVAQARAAIDAGEGTQGVYATGIVSEIVTAYNSQYSNVTFDIVDATGDLEYLRAYRCGGAEAANVAVGDVVVVSGNLTKYGEIYEFAQNCQVVSLEHPVITEPSITVSPANVDVDAEEHEGTLSLAYENLTINEMTDFDIQYYNAEGQEAEEPEWIEISVAEQILSKSEGYVVSYYMMENEGEARTAYFKVYAMDDETNLVYSDLVTISQEEYVAPQASITIEPATLNVSAEDYIIGNDVFPITYESIVVENYQSFEIQFYDANNEELQEAPAWLVIQVVGSNAEGYRAVGYISENTGEARTAYFKVYALDAEAELVYSNLVTINQAEYVVDYATLPFEFDGGRADIATTNGLTQEGLDSDYSSSPKLKFNTTGDWLLLHFNEEPGELTFDIKGNSFSGGTFTVQTSVDGETYEDLQVYNDNNLSSSVSSEELTLAADVRYIKWIYTEKVSGNVALGNIVLAKNTPAIVLSTYSIAAPAAETEGTITVTYKKIDFTNNPEIHWFEATGAPLPNGYEWITVDFDANNDVYYVINSNAGEARTAYFKVYGLDADANEVYSNLVTVSQEEYVDPLYLDVDPYVFELGAPGASIGALDIVTNLDMTDIANSGFVYYELENEEYVESTQPDWIELTFGVDDFDYINYTTTENTGDDRTAYFKFWLQLNSTQQYYYTDMITFSQVGPTTAPPALHTFIVNGVAGDIWNVTQGDVITLIDGYDLNDDFTFAGWTTDPNDVSQHLTGEYTLTQDYTEFYAIYGKNSTTSLINAATENFPHSYGTANEFEEFVLNGKQFMIRQAFVNNSNVLQFRASGNNNGTGTLYNSESLGTISSIVLNYNSSDSKKNFTLYAGTEANPTNGTVIEPTINGNEYTFDFSNGNYSYFVLTNGVNAGYLDNIIINATDAATALYTRVFLNETAENNITIVGPSVIPANSTLDMAEYTIDNTLGASSLLVEDGGQLVYPAGIVLLTMQKNITGYSHYTGEEANGGYWYLITAPLRGNWNTPIDPATPGFGLITDTYTGDDPMQRTYDLYSFSPDGGGVNGDGKEWRNYRQETFDIDRIMGYLYANKNDVTLNLQGSVDYQNGDVLVSDNLHWMLYGNPFPCNAYIKDATCGYFYRMNEVGDGFIVAEGAIKPLEGVFVVDGGHFTFSRTAPQEGKSLSMNLTRNGSLTDRAILDFGNGNGLEKFMFNENNTKLCIPQGNKDYAVVRSANEGEMPVSFKAQSNGTYTISVDPKNVEMNYLHLIDNMTGADINLLATPSYSFEAKTTDYASRFKLVFAANEEDGPSTSSGTFAFYNGSEWVVSNMGEATLQVVDMMGRVLSTETVSGNATMNTNSLSAGIYMMRLVKGEDVKVQKIVVR